MKLNIISRKIITVLNKPKVIFIKLLRLFSPLLNDKTYLMLLFPLYTGYNLDLDKPLTYNQKLQWLKLNFRKPIMTKMVDKYEAKTIVREIIGEEYVVKNYGVWSSFDEINFEFLPDQFVLKTTHDQGGVVICKDKSTFDYVAAKKKLNYHLKRKHFYLSREWPYKNVPPRIIAEEYLNIGEDDLKDYKFFCFNGVPKIMFISSNRVTGKANFDFYDMNFHQLDIIRGNGPSKNIIIKPDNFDLMVDLCLKLSVGFPHVRVDFYDINGKVLFGEFTFFSAGGLRNFNPDKWDHVLGSWINFQNFTN